MSLIRGKFRSERSGEHTALWREAIEGLHLVWHNQLLRAVIIQAPLVNFAIVLPSPLVALPVAVPILLSPTANAALFAAMLRAAPEGMRGRVNSTVIVAATGLAVLAPLTSGLLIEHVSGHWAMAAFAAATGVAAIMCVALPGLRNAGRGPATTGRTA